jgi:hypothetical protein
VLALGSVIRLILGDAGSKATLFDIIARKSDREPSILMENDRETKEDCS